MSQHPKISQLYNQAHSAAGITKKMQIQKLCAAAAAPLVVGLVTIGLKQNKNAAD
jgi:hypothetical protein